MKKIISLISIIAFFIVCDRVMPAEGKYVKKEIIIKWGHNDDEVGYEEIVKKGQEGVGGGDLISADFPTYIFVDYEGNIYVMDTVNDYAIKKFDQNGKFLMKIDYGKGLFEKYSVAVDRKGNVYVDTMESIIMFDSSGKFKKEIRIGKPIGLSIDLQDNLYVGKTVSYSEIYDFKRNSIKRVNYHFVDKEGYKYFATGSKINKYDKNDRLIKEFSIKGYSLNYPAFLGVDSKGNVYLVSKDDILRMDAEGELTHKIEGAAENKWAILGMDGNVYLTTVLPYNIIGTDSGLREEGFVITKYEFID